MKRTLSLWLGLAAAAGLLALALAPAQAHGPCKYGQDSRPRHQSHRATPGRRHGEPLHRWRRDLEVHLPGRSTGDYSGEAPQGTYMVVYRAADTPAGKMVDSIRGVKIVAGQDIAQDDDMSRQEYIDKMTPEEKKQLEELKKNNAEALKANALINQLNADLKVVTQDKKDIDSAPRDGGAGLGRERFQGRHCCQGGRDQDRQVHRYREPDDQGYGAQAGRGPAVEQPGVRSGRAQEV